MKNETKNKLIIATCLLSYIILGSFGVILSVISTGFTMKGSYLVFPNKLADNQDLSFSNGDIDTIQILIKDVNISDDTDAYMEVLVTSETTITSQSIINNGSELQQKSIIFRKIQKISDDSILITRKLYDLKPHSNLNFIIIAWELNNGIYSLPKDLDHFSLQYEVQYTGKIPLWKVYPFFIGALFSPIIPVIVFYRQKDRDLQVKSGCTSDKKEIDVSENSN